MEDEKIIELFFARSETVIAETDNKYGKSGKSLSYNILKDHQDAEECVNDSCDDIARQLGIPEKKIGTVDSPS